MKNKVVFETKDADGNVIKLSVHRPDVKTTQKAQLVFNATFARLVGQSEPAILREALETVARRQGLWDDVKQTEYENLAKKMSDAELKLKKGGIKRSEARDLCLNMRKWRNEMMNMRMSFRTLDKLTAQSQSEDRQFDYLVAACTKVEETGKNYFRDLDDYLERAAETASLEAANQLFLLQYNLDSDDLERQLPENQFLKKLKLVDDKFRLVNDEGKWVDDKGRLVDEDGYLLDASGNRVDSEGNKLNKDGEFAVDESLPFLNEDGSPFDAS